MFNPQLYVPGTAAKLNHVLTLMRWKFQFSASIRLELPAFCAALIDNRIANYHRRNIVSPSMPNKLKDYSVLGYKHTEGSKCDTLWPRRFDVFEFLKLR